MLHNGALIPTKSSWWATARAATLHLAQQLVKPKPLNLNNGTVNSDPQYVPDIYDPYISLYMMELGTAIAMLILTFISFKKNKYVFFASVYFIVLCIGIFFGIQSANMQDRLIIIVMPFIFLLLFYGTYELCRNYSVAQFVFIVFAGIMLLVTIGKSTIQAKENTTALKRNLSGDIYYGNTPDWENFLKMSKYCADSLPDSAQVLSRKPNMSFIYGNGKKFVGQYWVTTSNADSVLMEWKKENVKYILLPTLRMNPAKNNGRFINTIHRMLQPVAEKYPEKVKLVKTIGTDEPTYLYEINY